MTKRAELFRAEFHRDNPRGQIGAARYRQCCTMVGDLQELLEAAFRYQQKFWVEIFDDTTGERILGPVAPGEMENHLFVIDLDLQNTDPAKIESPP